jgi:hypothetical protein
MARLDYQNILDKVMLGDDGHIYWKPRRVKVRHSGTGYSVIHSGDTNYAYHRVLYILHTGEDPHVVDHINGDPRDNRIENLRAANPSQNQHNRRMDSTNKSGVKGVNWDRAKRKWRAQVGAYGVKHYLGMYDDKDEATRVVVEARNRLHGEFANHGCFPRKQSFNELEVIQ